MVLTKSLQQEDIMEKYIPVIMRGSACRIAVDHIIYIAKIGRKVRIAASDGPVEYYEKIENFFPFLDSPFYACLKTLVINMEKVERMENQTVYFQNGECWKLGRDNFVRTRQRYAAWLKHMIE